MNVLLVNPKVSKTELYGDWDLSDVKSDSPPLGLLSVAAYARSKGHRVGFHIANPHVVAITAMTIQIDEAAKIAKLLKSELQDVYTIIGGPHVTARPKETFRRYPDFDFGVVGEGEIVFGEFLDALSKQRDVRQIQGLVYRDNGDIRVNPRQRPLENLDTLPHPAYDLIPDFIGGLSKFGTKNDRSVGVVTSRGCPGLCTFCDRGVFGREFRCHSARYVIRLMDTLYKRYHVSDFLFFDDLFVANRARLKELCGYMKYRSYTWSCCARTDFIDKEMLPMMKRAGCHMIEYGIESGSERILKLMKKNTTKARIYETIQATKDTGIQSKGNFIFGAVGETLGTLDETIRFACSLPLDYFQHTFMAPLPGSEIWDTASDHGDFVPDWSGCNTFKINFVPTGLSKKDLLRKSKEAWLRFYLRPRIILNQLKSWRKLWAGLKAFLKTVLR